MKTAEGTDSQGSGPNSPAPNLAGPPASGPPFRAPSCGWPVTTGGKGEAASTSDNGQSVHSPSHKTLRLTHGHPVVVTTGVLAPFLLWEKARLMRFDQP